MGYLPCQPIFYVLKLIETVCELQYVSTSIIICLSTKCEIYFLKAFI